MGRQSKRPAPRNPVVRYATILRKGGAHGKSRKANRRIDKVRLEREIRKNESPVFRCAITCSAASQLGPRRHFCGFPNSRP